MNMTLPAEPVIYPNPGHVTLTVTKTGKDLNSTVSAEYSSLPEMNKRKQPFLSEGSSYTAIKGTVQAVVICTNTMSSVHQKRCISSQTKTQSYNIIHTVEAHTK